METNPLLFEYQSDGIGIITLNRPEKHNAFDDHVISKLTEILKTIEQDPKIKVLLLNANGKNFSAGADVEWMKRMIHYTEKDNLADAMQLVELLKTLFHCTKPTIALAKGNTMGGGIGLLCCCDIVLAEKDAKFCFSEAKLGLVPATIAPYVVRAIGVRAAHYYFLSAKQFNVEEAARIELVHEIVDQDILNAGMNFAKTLLKNGPHALTTIKKLLWELHSPNDSALQETAHLIAKVRASKEAQEGLTAFLEKRTPKWSDD